MLNYKCDIKKVKFIKGDGYERIFGEVIAATGDNNGR